MNAGTPLLLAALGIVINERSGVVNLGTEGMMLVAAVVGFATTLNTGHYWLGFIAGAVAGIVMAMLFAALAVGLLSNQFATGLALSLFGAGLSAFIGLALQGDTLPLVALTVVPILRDVAFMAPRCSRSTGWFTFRSRWRGGYVVFVSHSCGLILRAVGERPSLRTRSATQCAAFAVPRWPSVVRARVWQARICDDLHANLVGRDGRRARLDCARAGHVCDVAARAVYCSVLICSAA